MAVHCLSFSITLLTTLNIDDQLNVVRHYNYINATFCYFSITLPPRIEVASAFINHRSRVVCFRSKHTTHSKGLVTYFKWLLQQYFWWTRLHVLQIFVWIIPLSLLCTFQVATILSESEIFSWIAIISLGN